MKKSLMLGLTLFSVFALASCGSSEDDKYLVKDCEIIHELEFGGVYVKKTIEEFNNMGYEYGDSVDVTFSNGYELNDLPYYNGYYVDAGIPLLVGYPGYDYIKVAINYGDDMFTVANLNENDKATIKLHEKKKYLDIQNASDIHYYDERERYDSDIEFANFRAMNVGNIKDNLLYRAASPCDNKHNRAHYVDTLIENAHVEFILNLADTKEKIDSYIQKSDFNSPYFLSLYQGNKLFFASINLDNNVTLLAMNMNYRSNEFREKLVNGFKMMLNSDGPYLIHCLEGKDRTGFVCIVLEALMNASYTEIVDDYMQTYYNYYKITKDDSKYEIIKNRNVDSMLKFIIGNDNANLSSMTSFSNEVKNYLKDGGMTDTEINQLILKLSKED